MPVLHAVRCSGRSRLLTLVLMLALLLSQGLGLLHGVQHAGLIQEGGAAHSIRDSYPAQSPWEHERSRAAGTASASQQADVPADGAGVLPVFDFRHSCLSFDALTLAFALAFTGLAAMLSGRGTAPAWRLALPRPCLAVARRFQPRAPPLLPVA